MNDTTQIMDITYTNNDDDTPSSGDNSGESTSLLWLPYVLLSLILLALTFASFMHYHMKNKAKYFLSKQHHQKGGAGGGAATDAFMASAATPMFKRNTKNRVTMSRLGRVSQMNLTPYHFEGISPTPESSRKHNETSLSDCNLHHPNHHACKSTRQHVSSFHKMNTPNGRCVTTNDYVMNKVPSMWATVQTNEDSTKWATIQQPSRTQTCDCGANLTLRNLSPMSDGGCMEIGTNKESPLQDRSQGDTLTPLSQHVHTSVMGYSNPAYVNETNCEPQEDTYQLGRRQYQNELDSPGDNTETPIAITEMDSRNYSCPPSPGDSTKDHTATTIKHSSPNRHNGYHGDNNISQKTTKTMPPMSLAFSVPSHEGQEGIGCDAHTSIFRPQQQLSLTSSETQAMRRSPQPKSSPTASLKDGHDLKCVFHNNERIKRAQFKGGKRSNACSPLSLSLTNLNERSSPYNSRSRVAFKRAYSNDDVF